MNWKDVYQLPLTYDGEAFAWTQNNVMALHFDQYVSETLREKIVSAINGTRELKLTNLDGLIDVSMHDEPLYVIRGYGYLVTGTGGLNLSMEEADKIRDEFAEFVKSRLSNG